MDSNHVSQERANWQKRVSLTLNERHYVKLGKPVVGISGSPALVLTQEAAQEVACRVYRIRC